MTATYALILAGGAGTRFWPASRSRRPKQLLPLVGEAPLLLETARRVLPLCEGWSRILVGTGRHLADPTAAILGELAPEHMLTEPVPRNTAPCIAWAAARVARIDPDAVLMVLPSDHHIERVDQFRETLRTAVASAATGVITTIGIRPTHPETGFGYIELSPDAAAPAPGAVLARRFVEKPDRARAEAFLAGGRHLWNAGMFFFRARDMMAAIRAHLPALADGVEALAAAAGTPDEHDAVARIFPTLPSVSIDFGVMEHLDRLAVIPGDFGWSDLGSWQSAWELASHDERGNAAPDGTIFVDARDNQVVDLRTSTNGKRVVALVGVSDLVVVETDDALLVVPRERAQDVKHVVDQLKARGDTDLV
ncbi:Mannose-1-phosphate guanylyltransferase (GDP) [Minicystis rosea]|nr:Mannose-1-phosphate guanylyltransferase (GDP) [Minicystis rosea]